MGVDSDAEVIARSLAAGEAERFAAIFDRHFARVHRFFEWRVGRDSADDLAGEVFRVAFERRARYDVDRPDCLPWLYGIAINLLRQRQRSWGREVGALARESAAAVSAGRGGDAFTDDVDARVDAARHASELVTLLRGLTDGEREVVLLAAWEELSYDELADALGIPLGTVRSRLHRGRRKLREQLAANGDQPGDLDPSPTGERAP